MKSFTSRRFRELYANLPSPFSSGRAARTNSLFMRNPAHTGLNFKKLEGEDTVYSARIGLGYRVLGHLEGSEIIWFWIGRHGEYDKLV